MAFYSQQEKAPADRAHETMQLKEHQTSWLQLCGQPTVLSSTRLTVRFGGSCRSVYRRRIHDVDQLKLCLIEHWEHCQQAFIDEAVRQWLPHLRACMRGTQRTFWTQSLGVFDIRTDMQFDSHMSVRMPNTGHFTFWGYLTKPVVITVFLDGFHWNLVVCLQLDVASLV